MPGFVEYFSDSVMRIVEGRNEIEMEAFIITIYSFFL